MKSLLNMIEWQERKDGKGRGKGKRKGNRGVRTEMFGFKKYR